LAIELLSLQSEGGLDPARVGAKAARLAAALRAQLPVLPGLVLPVGADDGILAAAAAQVAASGMHAARFAVMGSTSPDLSGLGDVLRALGDDLVVRSSSPLEEAPEYAGVFTSYVGVTAAEAATAVRGVWASALTEAGPAAGQDVPRMAVLVQPRVEPTVSGTAQLTDDAEVTILAVRGSPAPLLSGWARGDGAVVDAAGRATGPGVALAGAALIAEVATLLRSVHATLGDDLIEWAATGTGVVLLQAKRAARRPGIPASVHEHEPAVGAEAAGVARLVHAFAGRLGEELMLPVLLAGVGPASMAPLLPGLSGNRPLVTPAAAGSAWVAAQAVARALRARAWRGVEPSGGDAAEVLAGLRSGELGSALERLASAVPSSAEDLSALLVALGTVVAWLRQEGAVSGAAEVWAMSAAEVGQTLASAEPGAGAGQRRDGRRRALLRWEPFIHTAVAGTGAVVLGEAVSAGSGAGVAVVVRGLPTDTVHLPRMVVVAPHPIPQLAPLLWGASGLVTAGGSAAAHLVEVARSRGVPAVIGCDEAQLFGLLDGAAPFPLVAVDGDAGRVVIDTLIPRQHEVTPVNP
jgi:phosphohistidine swiveling domain-containing protein